MAFPTHLFNYRQLLPPPKVRFWDGTAIAEINDDDVMEAARWSRDLRRLALIFL